MTRECPMCGEFMKLETREEVTRVPGNPREIRHEVREWVCPECDYFEEDDGPPPNPDNPQS
jgi:rubredoxin